MCIVMLQWFVEAEVADDVLKKSVGLIEEEEVEVRPEKIPDAVCDENVDIHLIRKFFTPDAWLVVAQVTEQKKKSILVCSYCSHDADEYPSIFCDRCLSWFHMKCVGLTHGPKTRNWFCRKCHQLFS